MKKSLLLLVSLPFVAIMAFGQAAAPQTNDPLKEKKEITLPAETLKKYAGVYRLNESFQVTISVENNKLYALAPGDQEKNRIYPAKRN